MRCCANCEFWDPSKERDTVTEMDEGDCHRYPPNVPCVSRISELGITTHETVRGSILMTYPVMYAMEWCGEFREATSPRIREES